MKIEVSNKRCEFIVNDDVSILNQLILLTQQYQRLNELMENKRTILQRKMVNSRKKRIQQQKHIQQLWKTLIKVELGDSMAPNISNFKEKDNNAESDSSLIIKEHPIMADG